MTSDRARSEKPMGHDDELSESADMLETIKMTSKRLNSV